MTMRFAAVALAGMMLAPSAIAAPVSGYAGQESREIKALSPEEVDAYLSGKGMGFAKAAELNGYPGPAHVLELAAELQLSADQRRRTEALFAAMQSQALDASARSSAKNAVSTARSRARRSRRRSWRRRSIESPRCRPGYVLRISTRTSRSSRSCCRNRSRDTRRFAATRRRRRTIRAGMRTDVAMPGTSCPKLLGRGDGCALPSARTCFYPRH